MRSACRFAAASLIAVACRSASPPAPTPAGPPSTPPPLVAASSSPGEERSASEREETSPPPLRPEIERLLALPHMRPDDGVGILYLRRPGPVRLTPNGAEPLLERSKPFPQPVLFVVAEDGEFPRIVVEPPSLRLLVYVQREDAHTLVSESTTLRDAPEPAADDRRGHIRLHPGALVEVTEERGDWAAVRYHGATKTLTGWVERGRLSPVARRGPRPTEARTSLVTTKRVPLTETPGGRALVTLAKGVELQRIGAAPGDGPVWAEYFEVCEKDYAYVGFVARAAVAVPQTSFGYGCGGGSYQPGARWGAAKDAPRVAAPAGRFLFAADEDIVVGRVLEDTEVASVGSHLAVPTPWGPLPVRLAPADFAP